MDKQLVYKYYEHGLKDGDWTISSGGLMFFEYITCQRFNFAFRSCRYNNPLVDTYLDQIDNMIPSGV